MMVSIQLAQVSLDFPLYQGGSRSLKKTLLTRLGHDRGHVVVHALRDISLTINHGERVGLVGHNGAGKTSLLRVLSGIYEPSHGDVLVDGSVSALLDVSLGLNPDATGYENIRLRGIYLGLRPREIETMVPEIAEFTELGDFLHMPVRTYSAGMTARLAFAVATAIHPEILLMDEWMLAGDAQFLDKARDRITQFVQRSAIMVLATHSLDIISRWSTRVIWLDSGRIIAAGDPDEILATYRG